MKLSLPERLKKIFGDSAQLLDARQRATVLKYVLNIAIPIVFFFILFNLYYHYNTLALVQCASLLLFVPAWFMANRVAMLWVGEFLALFATALILLYLIYDGGVAKLGFIWGWLFPFVAFYIAGIRRGWYWCIGFLIIAGGIFALNLGAVATYKEDTRVVFYFAYFFYLIVGYQFNAIRFQYLFNLEEKVNKRTAQLEHASLHDALTDLPNRANVIRHIQSLIDQQDERFAVLNLDINRFNEINNVLGYDNGNQLLMEFAKRIQSYTDDNMFVGSLSADEFTIVLKGLPSRKSKHDIHTIVIEHAERLQKIMERPYQIDTSTIEIEITIGIKFSSSYNSNANHMIGHANFACHVAKEGQEKLAVYDPEQDAVTAHQFQIFGGLKHALQEHDLCLFYQPKIDMRSRKATSVEALIRWISPATGMIPPGDFIPVAESTGLIHPITNFVLDEAMQQQALWLKKGYHINIAINLSARNLMDPGLIPAITDYLSQHSVSSDNFTLELTESAFMRQPEKALQTIRDLKEVGFSLSLDDYGTGYTSLSYLKDLPVDELKIDQSFIFNCMESDRDKAIVQSTIDLAGNLGLTVVAEGIENAAVWDFLEDIGCDKGQGYFMAKPMPAEEISQWLESSEWGHS